MSLSKRQKIAVTVTAMVSIFGLVAINMETPIAEKRNEPLPEIAMALAYRSGEAAGLADARANTPPTSVIDLAKKRADPLSYRHRKRVEWEEAFSRGYLDAFSDERQRLRKSASKSAPGFPLHAASSTQPTTVP
ncbi:MAG: hypothetical protein EXS32_01540 [Opitutus sp.]|nr:hypothetical protein [Opitutus sp.]